MCKITSFVAKSLFLTISRLQNTYHTVANMSVNQNLTYILMLDSKIVGESGGTPIFFIILKSKISYFSVDKE